MKIALNVNRTRITVLGFTLALQFFLIGALIALGSQHNVRSVWVFLPSFAQIATAFTLAMAALLLVTIAQRLDPEGSVNPWWFSIGELLMYLALAQTLSAALQLFVGSFVLMVRDIPLYLAGSPKLASEAEKAALRLTAGIQLLSALVWAVVIYVAPAVFLVKNPLPRRRKLQLLAGYAVMLAMVFWISSTAYFVHARARGESPSHVRLFVQHVWQPHLWENPSFPGKIEGLAGRTDPTPSSEEP